VSPHEDTNGVKDWVADTSKSISARLDSAKMAQSQTRFTLATMAVISGMMLIAIYNAYFSYDYNWIYEEKCQPYTAKNMAAANQAAAYQQAADNQAKSNVTPTGQTAANKAAADATKVLKEQAYKDWAASRTVMISLLGIRVSVDDAPVLGTAVLFVLSLWLMLVARRENHTIGFLLRDTDDQSSDGNQQPAGTEATETPKKLSHVTERGRIYQTIISNSLFVIFDHLPNVNSLAGENSLAATTAAANKRRRWPMRILLGFASSFFFWFPVIASIAMFVADHKSYNQWADPFALDCLPPGDGSFYRESRIAFYVCCVPLIICCCKANLYSRATEKVLREYGEKLYAYLLEENQPPKS
jgi:hypothetical protein